MLVIITRFTAVMEPSILHSTTQPWWLCERKHNNADHMKTQPAGKPIAPVPMTVRAADRIAVATAAKHGGTIPKGSFAERAGNAAARNDA